MTCLHCGAETSNGLALCELCRTFAASICQMLPVYLANLGRVRKPARPNGSLGTNGQWLIRHGETEGSRIAAALERAVNDIDTWARTLADDRDIELPERDTDTETAIATCWTLESHLTSIATCEWAGQFVRDIARHEKALRSLTETMVPGWYAGTCRQVTGRTMEGDEHVCGTDTFVIPGLTWVTCPACGAVTYARDHLEVILHEARGWLAPPKQIAAAIVALVDSEASIPRLYDRIRAWQARGLLAATQRLNEDGNPRGPRRYRLGDVLDLASRDTRRSQAERMTSA